MVELNLCRESIMLYHHRGLLITIDPFNRSFVSAPRSRSRSRSRRTNLAETSGLVEDKLKAKRHASDHDTELEEKGTSLLKDEGLFVWEIGVGIEKLKEGVDAEVVKVKRPVAQLYCDRT